MAHHVDLSRLRRGSVVEHRGALRDGAKLRRGGGHCGASRHGCHGERGHGSEKLPRLAGQVASYLAAQIRSFGMRERTNDNAVMHTIAARMTPAEIEAVAEYLSGLE